jgi:hypothetical protein
MSKPGILFVLGLVFVWVNRLPAPIVEEQQKPTPAPEQSEAPKSKAKHSHSSDRNFKNSNKSQSQISDARKTQVEKNPFHGRWVGTVDLGVYGNVAFTLTVDSASTTVNETSSKFGARSCAAQSDGKTLSWKSAPWFQAGIRTLTPNADGKTAIVTCSNGLIFKTTSVFNKL